MEGLEDGESGGTACAVEVRQSWSVKVKMGLGVLVEVAGEDGLGAEFEALGMEGEKQVKRRTPCACEVVLS